MAQLVEQRTRNAQVAGSNPAESSNEENLNLLRFRFSLYTLKEVLDTRNEYY